MVTVILGSALDIVEYCGVPRFLYSDFPLGNPCGKPGYRDMQLAIVRQALSMVHGIDQPRATWRAPFTWSENDAWRAAYARVDDSNRDALQRKGEQRRRQQADARAAGQRRAPMID